MTNEVTSDTSIFHLYAFADASTEAYGAVVYICDRIYEKPDHRTSLNFQYKVLNAMGKILAYVKKKLWNFFNAWFV